MLSWCKFWRACSVSPIQGRWNRKSGWMSDQQAFNLKPLAKLLNPVIAWQALFPHAEAMATFGIDMQFNRAVCCFPCGIQGHVSVLYIQIGIGKCDEQRRRIGWHGEIEPERTVDRRHKVRTTLSLVTFRRSTHRDDPSR